MCRLSFRRSWVNTYSVLRLSSAQAAGRARGRLLSFLPVCCVGLMPGNEFVMSVKLGEWQWKKRKGQASFVDGHTCATSYPSRIQQVSISAFFGGPPCIPSLRLVPLRFIYRSSPPVAWCFIFSRSLPSFRFVASALCRGVFPVNSVIFIHLPHPGLFI